MADITNTEVKRGRDVYYYRRRLKNRIFARLAAFFEEEAKRTGVTKKDIADRLKKDPSQITRWLSGPSNLTLDTLSDLLLALNAEADPPAIVRFEDRHKPNYVHPFIAMFTAAPTEANESSVTFPYNWIGRESVCTNPSSNQVADALVYEDKMAKETSK